MGFHLSEVIAKLIQGVGFWGEVELLDEGLMQITSSPGGTGPRVEEAFHETNHTGVMDFDAWDFRLPTCDGQGQALKEGEVAMDLEGLSLKGSETVDDGQQMSSYG